MNGRFVLRYLILIAVLAVCAGAAWYMMGTSDTHAADTVLAKRGNRTGKYAVLQRDIFSGSAPQRTDYDALQEKIPAGYGVLHGSGTPGGYGCDALQAGMEDGWL